MKRGRTRGRRGNALVEFTLFGIPIIFILISIFEMSRGMWVYETLAYAVKDAARYAAVHGQMCVSNASNCALTIDQLAARIQYAGVGLMPDKLNVTIQSQTRTITCNPLQDCVGNTACFPAAADCSATVEIGGMQGMPVTITARYPFQSAISMFWPGAGKAILFGAFNLPATARENIQF